jgi:4a-hydroxytetrahydrobiopterin dehydratase
MSEQGWRNFLAAHGDSDWVVLHGGAAAVFRVQSVVEAARLAEAIAEVPGLDGAGVLMTIADGQLTVRLARGVERLEERHVQLAHAISAIARERGALADRKRVQEVQLAISARPDEIDIGFWRAVLGYVELADDNAVDPLGHGSTVWMQDLDPAKPLRTPTLRQPGSSPTVQAIASASPPGPTASPNEPVLRWPERRAWDSNPRSEFPLIAVFKTAAIGH